MIKSGKFILFLLMIYMFFTKELFFGVGSNPLMN